MNRLLLIIFITVTCLFGVSCEKFLDTEPRGVPSSEQFYKRPAEMRNATAAIYAILLDNIYLKSEWLFGEATSDHANLNSEISITDDQMISTFTFSAENDWLLNRWKLNYQGIFRANYVITELPDIYNASLQYIQDNNLNISNFEPTLVELEQLFAEAKFLRALFYFNLVKTFGGVPIMPERIVIQSDEHNFIQPRNTEEEVYAYIERNLRESYLGLLKKDRKDIRRAGRVTKPAAIAYLMKTIGYQASPGVLNQQSRWQDVVSLGEHFYSNIARPISVREILDYDNLYAHMSWEELRDSLLISYSVKQGATGSGLDASFASQAAEFSLRTEYVKLPWAESDFGPESVFEANALELPLQITNINLGTNVWSSLSTDDYNWSGFFNATDKLKNSKKDDPRLQYCIVSTNLTWDTLTQRNKGFVGGRNQNMIFKYHVKFDEQPTDVNRCGRNIRFMRTAEVWLWYAEALNETGDPIAAISIVNRVRERANKIKTYKAGDLYKELEVSTANTLSMYPAGAYTITRDRIWRERELELIYEWDRFWDIVRQGRAGEMIEENYNRDSSGGNVRKFYKEGVNHRFAIPQEEIRKSGGILVQNPGY